MPAISKYLFCVKILAAERIPVAPKQNVHTWGYLTTGHCCVNLYEDLPFSQYLTSADHITPIPVAVFPVS